MHNSPVQPSNILLIKLGTSVKSVKSEMFCRIWHMYIHLPFMHFRSQMLATDISTCIHNITDNYVSYIAT